MVDSIRIMLRPMDHLDLTCQIDRPDNSGFLVRKLAPNDVAMTVLDSSVRPIRSKLAENGMPTSNHNRMV